MTNVLLLYDEITPALAKEFVGQMAKLSPTEPVTIAINSPGGSVQAGDSIALAIDRHAGPTMARIDGVAASAASFVAMFAGRTIMAPGSYLMIHCPYATMVGTADELTSAAAVLKQIEQRYCATYAARSGMPEADVLKMMRAETWLPAAKAVELGFADAIDRELALARKVSPMALKFRNVPSEVRAMAGGNPTPERTSERRQRLKRRLAIIAMQSRLARDPQREREDRERAERQRRRFELHATVARVRADEARRDTEERAQARRRLELDYFYDHGHVPREQRRY